MQCKAKSGEVGQAGMGGLPLPPNSQKAEFIATRPRILSLILTPQCALQRFVTQ
jgi:hypothetical protein